MVEKKREKSKSMRRNVWCGGRGGDENNEMERMNTWEEKRRE